MLFPPNDSDDEKRRKFDLIVWRRVHGSTHAFLFDAKKGLLQAQPGRT